MKSDRQQVPTDYDVIVIGGAVAGSSAAILLRRRNPNIRVLVVERGAAFDRKVGEATVEISALFFTKVLEISRALTLDHLPKHGLRFWFGDDQPRALEQMGELGPDRLPGMASFHMDRAAFDEHLLDLAAEAGAEIQRPARVTHVESCWPSNRVTIADESPESESSSRTVTTRWVIDASGRQTFLGRRMNLMEKPQDHAIAAVWARWSGVADLDGPQVLGPMATQPRLPRLSPLRGLSTNHFCGHGWWCWLIPLAGGDTSLGLVYDKRLFDLPGEGKIRDRYRQFLTTRPGLDELLRDATMHDDDLFAYKDLPYRTRQYADRGWALVGDAAAFLDPLYSSGLDHMAFSVYATMRLIDEDLTAMLSDDELTMMLTQHNRHFAQSYDRWLRSIYLDKYELFGDPELVSASYFIDIGTYYLGAVGSVYRDLDNFRCPVLGNDHIGAKIAAASMTAMKRRMVSLARTRRKLSVPSRLGSDLAKPWRQYPKRFELGPAAFTLVRHGMGIWARAEWRTLMHRLRRAVLPAPSNDMLAKPMPSAGPTGNHASVDQPGPMTDVSTHVSESRS